MNTPIEQLVEQFRRLPGIGVKTAQRLAYFIAERPEEEIEAFIQSIREVKEKTHYCQICFHLTSTPSCQFCDNSKRDHSLICVVENTRDVFAIERSRDYKGLYHVLQGALSPLEGIGVEDIRIKELLKRLESNVVQEIIIATDPDVEGEATAIYLARTLKQIGIKITRIARGIPMGGDIEYLDEITLAGAVENRREM